MRPAARMKVARFRGSFQDRSNATVPMVQSQHNASGKVRSHAFRAGRYAKVRCLKWNQGLIYQINPLQKLVPCHKGKLLSVLAKGDVIWKTSALIWVFHIYYLLISRWCLSISKCVYPYYLQRLKHRGHCPSKDIYIRNLKYTWNTFLIY